MQKFVTGLLKGIVHRFLKDNTYFYFQLEFVIFHPASKIFATFQVPLQSSLSNFRSPKHPFFNLLFFPTKNVYTFCLHIYYLSIQAL